MDETRRRIEKYRALTLLEKDDPIIDGVRCISVSREAVHKLKEQ